MNILILTDFVYPLAGGTERHTFELAKFAAKQGHNVHVLTPNWHNKKKKFKVEGVTLHRFQGIGLHSGIFRFWHYFFNALALHKKEDFSVFHSFYTVNIHLASVLASKIAHTKSVITLFEPEPVEAYFKNPLTKWLIRTVFNSADYLTTLNWTLEKIAKKWFTKTKISTVPNWIKDSFFKKVKPFKRGAKKIILFVGRLCEQKGAFVLLRALPLVRKKVNAELVFVGPPWEETQAREQAKKLGIEKHVQFIGFVSDTDLSKWYQTCDVMTYPTLYKGGFGFTVIEGMAKGKPVIGSDDVGIPDAIGKAGLISKRDNEKSLAKEIVRALSNKKLYAKLSKHAVLRAKEFTEKEVIPEYLSIYEIVNQH